MDAGQQPVQRKSPSTGPAEKGCSSQTEHSGWTSSFYCLCDPGQLLWLLLWRYVARGCRPLTCGYRSTRAERR